MTDRKVEKLLLSEAEDIVLSNREKILFECGVRKSGGISIKPVLSGVFAAVFLIAFAVICYIPVYYKNHGFTPSDPSKISGGDPVDTEPVTMVSVVDPDGAEFPEQRAFTEDELTEISAAFERIAAKYPEIREIPYDALIKTCSLGESGKYVAFEFAVGGVGTNDVYSLVNAEGSDRMKNLVLHTNESLFKIDGSPAYVYISKSDMDAVKTELEKKINGMIEKYGLEKKSGISDLYKLEWIRDEKNGNICIKATYEAEITKKTVKKFKNDRAVLEAVVAVFDKSLTPVRFDDISKPVPYGTPLVKADGGCVHDGVKLDADGDGVSDLLYIKYYVAITETAYGTGYVKDKEFFDVILKDGATGKESAVAYIKGDRLFDSGVCRDPDNENGAVICLLTGPVSPVHVNRLYNKNGELVSEGERSYGPVNSPENDGEYGVPYFKIGFENGEPVFSCYSEGEENGFLTLKYEKNGSEITLASKTAENNGHEIIPQYDIFDIENMTAIIYTDFKTVGETLAASKLEYKVNTQVKEKAKELYSALSERLENASSGTFAADPDSLIKCDFIYAAEDKETRSCGRFSIYKDEENKKTVIVYYSVSYPSVQKGETVIDGTEAYERIAEAAGVHPGT